MKMVTKFDNVAYGTVLTETFDICNVRLGSRDRDRSGSSTYTAPSGYRILGHRIHRSGHHSGTSHKSTSQPGMLTYASEAIIDLNQSIREGFAKGAFDISDYKGDGSAAAKYSKFMKDFHASYRFIADTNARITFRWYADSKSYDHGAHNVSKAVVRLEKAATEEDARRATEVIKFAIEMGEKNDIIDLMKIALNVEPEEDSDPPNIEVKDEEETTDSDDVVKDDPESE